MSLHKKYAQILECFELYCLWFSMILAELSAAEFEIHFAGQMQPPCWGER